MLAVVEQLNSDLNEVRLITYFLQQQKMYEKNVLKVKDALCQKLR
jgi:hypothetical protein